MRASLPVAVVFTALTACGGTTQSTVPVTGSEGANTAEPAPEQAVTQAQPEQPAAEPVHPLAGTWRGATDKARLVLVIDAAAPDAEVLEGKVCEAPDSDCTPLGQVYFHESKLKFRYQRATEGSPQTYTGVVKLQPSGEFLDGGLHSTACNCTSPLRLGRVP